MDPFLKELGELLREIRVAKGLAQNHIEPRISRTTLSKWESGKVAPNVLYLNAICEAYHISLADFFSLVVANVKKRREQTGPDDRDQEFESLAALLHKSAEYLEELKEIGKHNSFSRKTFFCRDIYYDAIKATSLKSKKSIKSIMDSILAEYLNKEAKARL